MQETRVQFTYLPEPDIQDSCCPPTFHRPRRSLRPFSATVLTRAARLSPSTLKSHALLDLGNRQAGVEALGACPGAVENGVAAVQAHRVVEGVLALGSPLVAGIDQPPVRLEQDGGAEVLLRVPPVRGARRRAARAENALVETVELLPVRLGLPVLLALRCC